MSSDIDPANANQMIWKRDGRGVPEWLQHENLELRYHPFPIGTITPAIGASLYQQMLDAWPTQDLFEFKANLGNKFTLGRKCNKKQFEAFLRRTPVWSRFDAWIRSDSFVDTLMDTLRERHVDLGHRPGMSWRKRTMKNLAAAIRGRPSERGARLAGSWEFQMIPANGGYLLPHTDAPNKVVTMTIAMVAENAWNPEWGGGIALGAPKNERFAYNHLNEQAEFEDLDWIDTLPFRSNSAVIFVKTFNSWHAVRPIQGPNDGRMRCNLVINICHR